eukprot:scaffold204313_cov33-Prasinocladus_malaysianus.AAC.2
MPYYEATNILLHPQQIVPTTNHLCAGLPFSIKSALQAYLKPPDVLIHVGSLEATDAKYHPHCCDKSCKL